MSKIDYEMHKRAGYADPSPYPEIKVIKPNLYHYFFFKDIDKELGELLENVSITEMFHMEILASTIKKLGGNPLIRGSYSTCNNFWNGSFIYYGKHLCERLKADIDSEYKAIDEYQKHICMINDPYVQKILRRIILDEKVHIKLFNKALLKFCGCTYKPLINE